MSSKSIWLRKSAPAKGRCRQTHNCVVVGMAPPEDVASEGPMRPKMHKTTGSMACYGCDRVQIVSVKHAPVLLVGNFDWIGSAARSLRFTARTAPRLRRHHARPARAAPPSHPWSNRTHKGLRSPQSPLGRAGGAANVVLSAVGGSFGRALA